MIDAVLIPDFAWKTVSKRSERFRAPFARLGPPADRKLWLFYSNFPRAFRGVTMEMKAWNFFDGIPPQTCGKFLKLLGRWVAGAIAEVLCFWLCVNRSRNQLKWNKLWPGSLEFRLTLSLRPGLQFLEANSTPNYPTPPFSIKQIDFRWAHRPLIEIVEYMDMCVRRWVRVRRIDIATHPSTATIVSLSVSASVSVSGECLPLPINSLNCREIIIKQSAVMRMG